MKSRIVGAFRAVKKCGGIIDSTVFKILRSLKKIISAEDFAKKPLFFRRGDINLSSLHTGISQVSVNSLKTAAPMGTGSPLKVQSGTMTRPVTFAFGLAGGQIRGRSFSL